MGVRSGVRSGARLWPLEGRHLAGAEGLLLGALLELGQQLKPGTAQLIPLHTSS